MKARRIPTIISDSFCLFLFVYLLIFPDQASAPTKSALEFCAKTLIPSLFIYTVLARVVISLPVTERLARGFGVAPITLLIGILCGAPLGAKTAVSLYERGSIDKKYAEYLCSFTNNASASFTLGVVGSSLFGNKSVGVRLLAYQLISSLFVALVMRFYMFGKCRPVVTGRVVQARTGLREAVWDAAYTMLNICACAVFFIVAASAVSNLLSLPPIFDALLRAVLEFSSGCASAAGLNNRFALPLTAFSIGFSGLSVALQVRSVTAGRLSVKPYLLGKLLQSAVMTLLAVIFG